jgi:hypothetical protein
MNRRILNSTYGGVGGRGRQLPLLPDMYMIKDEQKSIGRQERPAP